MDQADRSARDACRAASLGCAGGGLRARGLLQFIGSEFSLARPLRRARQETAARRMMAAGQNARANRVASSL
jgi:hypothetical protein